jgi:hypothetical protein
MELENLHSDLLKYIFNFLDCESTLQIRLVSKKLMKLNSLEFCKIKYNNEKTKVFFLRWFNISKSKK